MNYAVYLPIWLLLFNMIIINNRKRKTILITKFFNRTEREKKEMFELAKRFIEKYFKMLSIIYLFFPTNIFVLVEV